MKWVRYAKCLTEAADEVAGGRLEHAARVRAADDLERAGVPGHEQQAGGHIARVAQTPARRSQGRHPPALRVGGQETLEQNTHSARIQGNIVEI